MLITTIKIFNSASCPLMEVLQGRTPADPTTFGRVLDAPPPKQVTPRGGPGRPDEVAGVGDKAVSKREGATSPC